MVNIGSYFFPKPLDHHRLEIMVRDLLTRKYGIIFNLYGRRGQKQHGIDIYAQIPDKSKWNEELHDLVLDQELCGKYIVIQVKSRPGSNLTFKTIKEDYNKINQLGFEVGIFLTYTSADNDSNFLEELEKNRSKMPLFKNIVFWEDICIMLEQNMDYVNIYYGFDIQNKTIQINEIRETLEKYSPEISFEKSEEIILSMIDDAIDNGGIINYRTASSLLVDCMPFFIKKIPDKTIEINDTSIGSDHYRNRFIGNFDLIFKKAFFRMLNNCYDKKDYLIGIEILIGIEYYVNELCNLRYEAIYSNWVSNFRAFYKEKMEPTLNELKRVSYNEELYSFVIYFSDLFCLPIIKSLELHEGIFTINFGLDVILDLIKSQINKLRLFYTSEDDFSFPTPFSVMIEPVMRGLSKCTESLTSFPDEIFIGYEKEGLFEKITEIIFVVLEKYKQIDSLDDIDRSQLPSILSNIYIVNSDNFSEKFEELMDINKPAGLDSVIRPVLNTIKRNDITNYKLKEIFDSSLNAFNIQRLIYGAVSSLLLKLCIECILKISDEYEPNMIIQINDYLISEPKRRYDDSIIYGYLLLGRLLIKNEQKYSNYITEKILETQKIEQDVSSTTENRSYFDYIKQRLSKISTWEKKEYTEEEMFKPPSFEHEEWEVNASKEILLFIENMESNSN